MVVDDSPAVAVSLLTLLRNEGFDPIVFQSGQPALDYLRQNRPEIALIDIHLPDIPGLEIARQIREIHGASLPIIICSGDSSLDALLALPDAGATYFFHKPISVSRLMECLREIARDLHQPPGESTPPQRGATYPSDFNSTAM
jgi:DNA-binding response OmpR family regulator